MQLRIEAQGKYMQTILEKACQTLAGENMAAAAAAAASGSYTKPNMVTGEISGLKDFGPPQMNFPSLQDLNIYGPGTDHTLDLHHQSMDRSSLDPFLSSGNDSFFSNKKRPNPYTNSNTGKSPLIWADDLRLQDLGSSGSLDDHHIQLGTLDRGSDSVSDIYESKPILSGEHSIGDKKSYDSKMERPSPHRVAERLNHAAISAGGRSSPFG